MFVFLLHLIFFFFNDTATTEIYTLSLHDALPISRAVLRAADVDRSFGLAARARGERLGTREHPAHARRQLCHLADHHLVGPARGAAPGATLREHHPVQRAPAGRWRIRRAGALDRPAGVHARHQRSLLALGLDLPRADRSRVVPPPPFHPPPSPAAPT